MAEAVKDDEMTVEERLARLQKQARVMMAVTAATLLLAGGGTAALFAYVGRATAHPADRPSEEEAQAEGGHGGAAAGDAHGSKPEGHGGGHGAAEAPAAGGAATDIHSFDPFVVNLLDAANVRYVKVRLAVETPDAAVAEEIRRRDAQLKDSVIAVLSNRTYADLQGIHGKNQVRDELLLRFNKLIGAGRVTRLYFTEFVVQ
ncbi:flagellar basal body-associated FliL family protein [Myxococcota bacterium]|nr:flagellar basal body-associated FliL family protein [Myxococcota bacterium]